MFLTAGPLFAQNGEPVFIRGDNNADGKIDIGDVIFLLNSLFQGGTQPTCLDASDNNDDGLVNLTDAVYSFLFQFHGGRSFPAPYPYAGIDPTPDNLDCRSSPYGHISPRIYFSDLISGPAKGGPDGQGAIVSIYGSGFGNSQGDSYVMVGEVEAYRYLSWTNKRITFQIAQSTSSGQIYVRHEYNGDSNNIPFTVRPGNLYFAATTGNDNNPGTFDQPWKNLVYAKMQLQPGDILYVKNNMTITEVEDNNAGRDAALLLDAKHTSGHGTAEKPIAMVVMPGVTVKLGCAAETCPQYGIWLVMDHWIIAGFTASGNLTEDKDEVDHWGSSGIHVVSSDARIIANTVTDGYYGINVPNNNFSEGSHRRNNIKIFGNYVHNTRNSLIYYGGFPVIDGKVPTGLEIGWNTVHDNQKGFGIKLLAHKEGDKVRDVFIHHNIVYNVEAAGIQLGNATTETGETIDFIENADVSNNVIYDTGRSATASCVYSTGEPVMNLTLRHNTMVNCGVNADQGSVFDFEEFTSITVENNIFYQPDGKKFFRNRTGKTHLLRNNIFFGSAPAPSYGAVTINKDPKFVKYGNNVNQADYDFHITPISPVIDVGVGIPVAADMDGLSRPQGTTVDLGAFEFLPTP